MAKITNKLQVTIPKAIAEQYRLRPGSEITFVAAGAGIRVTPVSQGAAAPTTEGRLRLFDQATERQRARQRGQRRGRAPHARGWKREELYHRGVPG